MTSKEALKRIKDDIEINYLTTKHNNEKDKYNYLELLKIIEKDLKLLEVLKKKMIIDTDYYDSDDGCEEFEYIAYNGQPLNIENKQEYDLLKEWLENDK